LPSRLDRLPAVAFHRAESFPFLLAGNCYCELFRNGTTSSRRRRDGSGTGVGKRAVENPRRTILKPQPMYKVIIQSTPVGESNWRVVTTGMWNPGEPPRLAEEILPANVVESTVQHHTFGNESIRANPDARRGYVVCSGFQETFEVATTEPSHSFTNRRIISYRLRWL